MVTLETVAILTLVVWVALLHRQQRRFALAGYHYDEHVREIARQEVKHT
jgi:hypothetical protein